MASQSRLDQIRDLVNQFEQLAGYIVTVPDSAIEDMADNQYFGGAVTSLYQVGQYMQLHRWQGPGSDAGLFVPSTLDFMPWAKWGMSAAQYDSKLSSYDSAFRTLTGQSASQDIVDEALRQHQGTMTGQQFETWLMAQDAIKQQYGWLRYGLDFQQFQTQKLQMRSQFGRDLTDAEATAQLQHHHAAQGGNLAVSAQPTLGQAEKKQAQVGVGGSVVR